MKPSVRPPEQVTTDGAEPAALPVLAWRPVLLVAAAAVAVLLAVITRYGYAVDELYFIAAGAHPEWGYADQPPLLPMLAHLLDRVSGGSLIGLRVPAALMVAAGVVLTAFTTRELGGRGRAQVIASAAFAVSPIVLAAGHNLTTVVVDMLTGTALVWLLVRWVRVREDRLLLWAGLVTAVALQGKYIVVLLWIALAVCALVVGPRDLLRRPMLWIGGGIAVLTSGPALWWQAAHGWPQLAMSKALADQHVGLGIGGPTYPITLLVTGLLVGVVLHLYGLWRLLRSPELRDYRFLGWAVLGLSLFFWVSGGRYDYLLSFFALLYGVAAVELQRRRPAVWWRWVPTWPVFVLSAVYAVASTLPVYPAASLSKAPENMTFVLGQTAGWPELAGTVSGVYHSLPEAERRGAVIVANDTGEAAALDKFGPSLGLPSVYSGHRGYWYFGAPAEDSGTVIFVGADPGYLRQDFGQVRQAATTDNKLGLGNMAQGLPVWVCQGRTAPWSQLWPHYQHLNYAYLDGLSKKWNAAR